MEELDLMAENWDFLIILDACRYDYFKRVYRDYLPSGSLKKVRSPASNTLEWCKKVFRERYEDVVYISTNPFINSVREIRGFDAKEHFHKIVDVWNWGWDEKLGTVHPETVNLAAQKAIDASLGKRFIIHYLQPHGPYLSLGFLGSLVVSRRFAYGEGGSKFAKARFFFGKMGERILGQKVLWKLRELIGLPPIDPLDAALRVVGEEGLRKAYEENLKVVLNHVAELLPKLHDKIVITADHGELLGEGGLYGHPTGLRVPAVVEIPWLKIERSAESPIAREKRGIRHVIRRLKERERI